MIRAGAPASHEFSIPRREKRIKPCSEALKQGGLIALVVGFGK
jgi:hypothetical protein